MADEDDFMCEDDEDYDLVSLRFDLILVCKAAEGNVTTKSRHT